MTTTKFEHTSEMPDRLLTLEEVRDLLQVSKWTIYQLINQRQLKSITIGRSRFVTTHAYLQLLENLDEDQSSHGW